MKKNILVPLALFTCFSLQSCFLFPEIIVSSTYKTASGGVEYKTPNYTSSFSSDNLNQKTIGLGNGCRYLPSTGTDKLLVIPVSLDGDEFTEAELSMIQKGFFGDESETGWESISSYYNKSSYGKLSITGTVTSPVHVDYTKDELNTLYESKGSTVTDAVFKLALEGVSEEVDLSEYDIDEDGYIDAVWLVYSLPYQTSSAFWAYTTWSDSTIRVDDMFASLYSWGSVDFFTRKDYSSLFNSSNIADAHTFIHETGHMLGLDDYYSYDYNYSYSNRNGNSDTPLGGADMMDFNVGDQCAFSKYLLGWSKPTLVSEEYLKANNYSITLKSSTESGNSLLIPIYKDGQIDYNNTAFDEYLLVEYYTPTSLNKSDSEAAYANGFQLYSSYGVCVYHIDARIGKMVADKNGGSWDGYVYDKLPSIDSKWGHTYLYTYLYSNTKSYSWETSLDDEDLTFYRGRLISLLPATGKKISGDKTGWASNKSLFTSGKSFDSSTYPDFIFDDGSKPSFSFSVKETSVSNCVLNFGDF